MSVYELKSENIVRHNLSARGLAITAKVKQYYDVIYIYIYKKCVCAFTWLSALFFADLPSFILFTQIFLVDFVCKHPFSEGYGFQEETEGNVLISVGFYLCVLLCVFFLV